MYNKTNLTNDDVVEIHRAYEFSRAGASATFQDNSAYQGYSADELRTALEEIKTKYVGPSSRYANAAERNQKFHDLANITHSSYEHIKQWQDAFNEHNVASQKYLDCSSAKDVNVGMSEYYFSNSTNFAKDVRICDVEKRLATQEERQLSRYNHYDEKIKEHNSITEKYQNEFYDSISSVNQNTFLGSLRFHLYHFNFWIKTKTCRGAFFNDRNNRKRYEHHRKFEAIKEYRASHREESAEANKRITTFKTWGENNGIGRVVNRMIKWQQWIKPEYNLDDNKPIFRSSPVMESKMATLERTLVASNARADADGQAWLEKINSCKARVESIDSEIKEALAIANREIEEQNQLEVQQINARHANPFLRATQSPSSPNPVHHQAQNVQNNVQLAVENPFAQTLQNHQ